MRRIRNTHIQSVGRTQSFNVLDQVTHIVTTGFYGANENVFCFSHAITNYPLDRNEFLSYSMSFLYTVNPRFNGFRI